MRAAIERVVARKEFGIASAFATDLANLLREDGRYNEALRVVGQAVEYTKSAGLGPWTQLLDEGQRLQILALIGENDAVLRRVREVYEEMKTFPDPAGPNESTPIWAVARDVLGHRPCVGSKA